MSDDRAVEEMPVRAAPPQRAWQRMLSGRRLDLLQPSPADIEIADIAHGLARVARWNGQTLGEHALSVAQHCLIVEEIARDSADVQQTPWTQENALAALLHDAPEYVVGDLISPFKAAIGFDYKAFEIRLLQAIHARFGLPAHLPDGIVRRIKEADQTAAFFEATVLAGFTQAEVALYFTPPNSISADLTRRLERLEAWPTRAAQQAFLVRFQALHIA
jgi:uncharacterized protein